MVSAIFPPGRVTIVAILNVTPDSFSDAGRFARPGGRVDVERAVDAAALLVAEGAHILDVGGESTRPGARSAPADVEIERTAPVIEALAKRLDLPISIDTRKASVAEAALGAGARLVNDVSGLRHDAELAGIAARAKAGLILGHLRGDPETMQDDPHFDDVLREVGDELADSVRRAVDAGVAPGRIVVDPGIGFGKRLKDNLVLMAHPRELGDRVGHPVLVGPSRKAFLGTLTGDPVGARDAATAAACAIACFAGADGVRVHDVAGAVRAVAVGRALRSAREQGGARR